MLPAFSMHMPEQHLAFLDRCGPFTCACWLEGEWPQPGSLVLHQPPVFGRYCRGCTAQA